MIHRIINIVVLETDAAKLKNTPGELTVYAALESAANLTVKFHINPTSNYTVYWSMGDLLVQDSNIRDTIEEHHVQTTYFIYNVTHEHLGTYNVRVINWAIIGEQNISRFNMTLKLPGKFIKMRLLL